MALFCLVRRPGFAPPHTQGTQDWVHLWTLQPQGVWRGHTEEQTTHLMEAQHSMQNARALWRAQGWDGLEESQREQQPVGVRVGA